MKKTILTLALILSTGIAQAIPLSDLLAGQSVNAGDKMFDSWQVTFNGSSEPLYDPNYANINITALNDGDDDPGPGINIDFGDQMTVSGDGIYAYRDITIDFRVSTLGDKLIKDNSLTFGAPASVLTWVPDGLNDLGMAVEEWVYDALGNELAHKYIEFSILDDIETRNWPDAAAFDPQSEIFVRKNFLVWAVDESDTALLGGVQQRFSQQVPEPGTLALLGLGIAAMGLGRIRICQRNQDREG